MNQALKIVFIAVLVCILMAQIVLSLGLYPKTKWQKVCPVNAIHMRNGKAVIDTSKCIGCNRCVSGFKAISDYQAVKIADSVDVLFPDNKDNESTTDELKVNSILKESNRYSKPNPKQEKVFHKVREDKCISCELCVPICPVEAITMRNGKAHIDKFKCINCGLCTGRDPNLFDGCPVNAISAVSDSI